MKKIISHFEYNQVLYYYLIVLGAAFLSSISILYNPMFIITFENGQNLYLMETTSLFREILLLELVWAFMKIFVIWMASFAGLFLIKTVNHKRNK